MIMTTKFYCCNQLLLSLVINYYYQLNMFPRTIVLLMTTLTCSSFLLLSVVPMAAMVSGYSLHHIRHVHTRNQLSSSSSSSFTTLQEQTCDSAEITLDSCIERRVAMQKPFKDVAIMLPFGAVAIWSTTPAWADTSPTTSTSTPTDSTSTKNTLINQLLDQLRGIPTFCIVSNTTGAAYMIYKRDLNMGIGYAFLTYDGAVTVLNEAQQNAIQKGYTNNIWTNATITTLPLDVAVRLTLKKRNRVAVNNRNNDTNQVQSLDTLLQIIPGADERFDGLAIDKERFQDQGRVPLFYVLNDHNDNNNINNEASTKTVFYLNRKDLIRDWTTQQQSPAAASNTTTLPKVGAIDLIGIFESLLLGRAVPGKIGSSTGHLFPTTTTTTTPQVEFIGKTESIAMAKALKTNGPFTPYNPNQMIL